jgi:hypothetical protein
MAGTDDIVRELHGDLARKYRLHGSEVVRLWSSFTKAQRTNAIRQGAAEGVVLKHRNDVSIGDVCKFIPEWNLSDLIDPETTTLTDLLHYRATTTLSEQYRGGHPLNPGNGDHGHILEMQRTRNLRHVNEDL